MAACWQPAMHAASLTSLSLGSMGPLHSHPELLHRGSSVLSLLSMLVSSEPSILHAWDLPLRP